MMILAKTNLIDIRECAAHTNDLHTLALKLWMLSPYLHDILQCNILIFHHDTSNVMSCIPPETMTTLKLDEFTNVFDCSEIWFTFDFPERFDNDICNCIHKVWKIEIVGEHLNLEDWVGEL